MNNQRRKGEGDVDRECREILFQYTLEGVVRANAGKGLKYVMQCPFCSHLRSKESKKRVKCSALIWIEPRNCFRFQCFNQGSQDCKVAMEFPEFLRSLDPGLFREYQLKRFHAGTTGGRWNCPHLPGVEEIMRPPGAHAP